MMVETNAQLQEVKHSQRDELSSLGQTQSGEVAHVGENNLINKWLISLHTFILVLCSLQHRV